jgi:hypothetical protein
MQWVLAIVGTLLVGVGLWDLLRQKLTGAAGVLKIGQGGEAHAPVAFLVLLVGAALLAVGAMGITRQATGGGAASASPAPPGTSAAPVPAPPTEREKVCAKSCELASSCGAVIPDCVAGCVANDASYECARTTTTCDELASCAFAQACGKGPSGTLGCGAAWKLATSTCKWGDPVCGCRVTAQVAPNRANDWGLVAGCLAACGQPSCVTGQCAGYIQRCMAR